MMKYIYIYTHYAVYQKLAHCKSTILQRKKFPEWMSLRGKQNIL